MKGIIHITLVTAVLLASISCTNRASYDPPPDNPDSVYFSIRLFAKDQWETYYAKPYTLYRVITLNGHTDSTLVNFFNIDWGAIFKTFWDADIGQRKFVGRYNYTGFLDENSGYYYHVYEAMDPDLFTRQMQITVDPVNNHILSVYIETFRKERLRERRQRILYKPADILQIQEDTHETPGGARSLRVEYRFLR